MNWNDHSKLKGQHAFLGASKFAWLNYTPEKLVEARKSFLAAQQGTLWHEFAAQCITLGQKLPKSRKTLNLYVNDAIGFRMTPEQVLYYSPYCFGTADAICVRGDILRIHDLKTGRIPAHMEQLYIYAALFCLEYRVRPMEMGMELRIYQNNEVLTEVPEPQDVLEIMNRIIEYDKILSELEADHV